MPADTSPRIRSAAIGVSSAGGCCPISDLVDDMLDVEISNTTRSYDPRHVPVATVYGSDGKVINPATTPSAISSLAR